MSHFINHYWADEQYAQNKKFTRIVQKVGPRLREVAPAERGNQEAESRNLSFLIITSDELKSS